MSDVKYIFSNLLWPAAAGNVIWSFFQVIIADTSVEFSNGLSLDTWAVAICLTAIGIYTSIGCIRHSKKPDTDFTILRSLFHLIHILLIIAIAVSLIAKPDIVGWLLVAFFGSSILDHILSEQDMRKIAVNGLGIIIVALSCCIECFIKEWVYAASLCITLVLWCWAHKTTIPAKDGEN